MRFILETHCYSADLCYLSLFRNQTMIVPSRLFVTTLWFYDCHSLFLKYSSTYEKHLKCSFRIKFLRQCCKNNVIPRFLKFRIPNNRCFDKTIVPNFQTKLLKKELNDAHHHLKKIERSLDCYRSQFRDTVPRYIIHLVMFHIRRSTEYISMVCLPRHKKKLSELSLEQDKSLRSCLKTVVVTNNNFKPPQYWAFFLTV